jgi:hypothetical protein
MKKVIKRTLVVSLVGHHGAHRLHGTLPFVKACSKAGEASVEEPRGSSGSPEDTADAPAVGRIFLKPMRPGSDAHASDAGVDG